jgi:hypothetical protein
MLVYNCSDCVLDGSPHVAQLKLNHAFNVFVKVVFTWVGMLEQICKHVNLSLATEPALMMPSSCILWVQNDGKAGRQPGITGTASLDVDVDMPFPFSAMPRPMLEGAGDAAFKTTLALMLNVGQVAVSDAWLLYKPAMQ